MGRKAEKTMSSTMSRREFFEVSGGLGATAFGPAALQAQSPTSGKNGRKIRDIQTMTITGERTYILVRVLTSDGQYGIAEAYGTPDIGVKEQINALKSLLVGKDPLEIDVIYTFLGKGGHALSGSLTDGSAHTQMNAASGIEMALWDLAGRILNVPTVNLLGGKFRDKVRVYDHAAPRNMLDKASCAEWAQKVKADPSGFTAHKFGFPRASPNVDNARDPSNRVLTTRELIDIARGYENCREAIGWDHDIMVHCHWQFDLRTSIQLAQAIAPIKPLWLEDPLPVVYSDSWKRLCASSEVPILTGENLECREGFKDFIVNQGCDILHPDLRNSGGFLETKRIADMAETFALPIATHNTGSQVHTWATCQWAASIRDYMCCETITGRGGWMDKLLLLDGPYIEEGHVKVSNRPGLGIELNPDVVKAHLADGERWWE
jgi:L-alanine-DL-glutamate epimerase-like enolase superfamily enzyme